jgi:N-acetylglutamate synthase-like GNAT family acetyltransferase
MPAASEIEIRLARADDVASIGQVLHASFVEYESLYTPEGFAATAQQVLKRMQEGPVWVAISEGRVVGTVAALMKGKSLYMRGMAVQPMARGLGVARRMLAQVEQRAREKQATRIFLSTTPFLTAAIELYGRAGFQRTSEPPHELFGTPLLTMEKSLSA